MSTCFFQAVPIYLTHSHTTQLSSDGHGHVYQFAVLKSTTQAKHVSQISRESKQPTKRTAYSMMEKSGKKNERLIRVTSLWKKGAKGKGEAVNQLATRAPIRTDGWSATASHDCSNVASSSSRRALMGSRTGLAERETSICGTASERPLGCLG
jgi:hypothetical protein